jgi:hypothetical protein
MKAKLQGIHVHTVIIDLIKQLNLELKKWYKYARNEVTEAKEKFLEKKVEAISQDKGTVSKEKYQANKIKRRT